MAINTRRISGLAELPQLSGDEYLMVAYNNKSYKVKTSLFTSDIISTIEQEIVTGDDAESPIKITTSAGATYTFYVKNGSKGSDGDTGKKGPDGDPGNTGLAIYMYDETYEDRIIDNFEGINADGEQLSDSELSSYTLSAKQGSILNQKLDDLNEVYLTQEEYDNLLNDGEIDVNTKYFIWEE